MNILHRFPALFIFLVAAAHGLSRGEAAAQSLPNHPYTVISSTQVTGSGGIDYVYADSAGRRLYVPRGGEVLVFDLDTLKQAGAIPNARAHGVAVDQKVPPRLRQQQSRGHVGHEDARNDQDHFGARPPGWHFIRSGDGTDLCPQPCRAQCHGDRRERWLDHRHDRPRRRSGTGRQRWPGPSLRRYRGQGQRRRRGPENPEGDRPLRTGRQERRRRPRAGREKRGAFRLLPRTGLRRDAQCRRRKNPRHTADRQRHGRWRVQPRRRWRRSVHTATAR